MDETKAEDTNLVVLGACLTSAQANFIGEEFTGIVLIGDAR